MVFHLGERAFQIEFGLFQCENAHKVECCVNITVVMILQTQYRAIISMLFLWEGIYYGQEG